VLITVNDEGRITIPREVRSALGIGPGSTLDLDFELGRITMRVVSITEGNGNLSPREKESDGNLRERLAPKMHYFQGPRMLDDMITVVREVTATTHLGAAAPQSLDEARDWLSKQPDRCRIWAIAALAMRFGGIGSYRNESTLHGVVDVPARNQVPARQFAVGVFDNPQRDMTLGQFLGETQAAGCTEGYIVCCESPTLAFQKTALVDHVIFEPLPRLARAVGANWE